MEIERTPQVTANPALREHILSELKSDFRFSLFYLLPKIRPGRDWRQIAADIRLPEKLAERFMNDLISASYWTLEAGNIVVAKDHVDLGDLKISEFLSLSFNLLAQMQATGPCWYEALLIITNDSLKKDFYRKVNQALKELIVASKEVHGDSVLAWSHAGLDCLKALEEAKP